MIRDIMVHLDGSTADDIRLDYGQAIASTCQAHLVGILTTPLPDLAIPMPMDGGAAAIQVLTDLENQARKDGDAAAQRLTERLANLQVPNELRRCDETFGALLAKVVEQARCADLFITTRPYGDAEGDLWTGLVESVLFGSGRALMLVPPTQHQLRPIRTVLVAWNGSREAARALREGLDFIEQAARTIVLLVDPPAGTAPGADVESHLVRHGVSAEVITTESRGRSVGDVILDEAKRLSADLIVMGGYGHARLREQVFGGATWDLLTVADIPLLMAH